MQWYGAVSYTEVLCQHCFVSLVSHLSVVHSTMDAVLLRVIFLLFSLVCAFTICDALCCFSVLLWLVYKNEVFDVVETGSKERGSEIERWMNSFSFFLVVF